MNTNFNKFVPQIRQIYYYKFVCNKSAWRMGTFLFFNF